MILREKGVEIFLNTEVKKIITEPLEIEKEIKNKHFCAKVSRIVFFDKVAKKSLRYLLIN